MPLLEASFEKVPNKFQPVGSGIYKFNVKKADLVSSKNPDVLARDPKAMNLECEFEVLTDGEQKGRTVKRTISTKMLTEIKRLALSVGIPEAQINSQGINTDLIVGRECKGIIKPNTYKDNVTGQMRENTQLAEFLIPGDAGFDS